MVSSPGVPGHTSLQNQKRLRHFWLWAVKMNQKPLRPKRGVYYKELGFLRVSGREIRPHKGPDQKLGNP
jgi:hypothetical protein